MSTRRSISIDARRREVGRLYLSGKTQPEIAKEYGTNQATISRDLKALRQAWLASALVDINEAKSKELAKIDVLELEYWEAWRRSLAEQVREMTRAFRSKDANPTTTERTVTKVSSVGDPRFLSGIQWCIDKRCKILGLDAPQQVEVSWQSEIIDMLSNGEIEPDQVERDFGAELATEFFKQAGINVVSNE